MRTSGFNHYALSCAALALLAGCGGSQPPIGAPGAMPQTSAPAAHAARADRDRSWMLPEAASERLLYLASNYGPNVYVYSYPGGKLVGTLTGFEDTQYECVDQSGDVFITEPVGSSPGIYEYVHGGSEPINYLPLSSAVGCSVDPKTGNLAVVTFGKKVYIYPNAKGTPTIYTLKHFYFAADTAYDDAGNLFIDGATYDLKFTLIELPSRSSNFKDIKVSANLRFGIFAPIQWDGKYLAIASTEPAKQTDVNQSIVNRVQIDDSLGKVVAKVPLALQRNSEYPQFWIQHGVVIQPSNRYALHSYYAYFEYPAGSRTRKFKLTGGCDLWGAVISASSSENRSRRPQ